MADMDTSMRTTTSVTGVVSIRSADPNDSRTASSALRVGSKTNEHTHYRWGRIHRVVVGRVAGRATPCDHHSRRPNATGSWSGAPPGTSVADRRFRQLHTW